MEEDVITLSSDEDIESPKSLKMPIMQNISEKEKKSQPGKLRIINMINNNQIKELKVIRKQGEDKISPIPEVVDLADNNEKSPENYNSNNTAEGDSVKNHSADGLNPKISSTCLNTPLKNYVVNEATSEENITLLKNYSVNGITAAEKPTDKFNSPEKPVIEIVIDDKVAPGEKLQINSKSEDQFPLEKNMTEGNCNESSQDTKKQISNKDLSLFKEFTDYCGSLEENPKDREKLIGKLNKYYAEAEPHYVQSKQFKNLIIKCKNKIHVNNLYLVAKTVSDELKLQKNIENRQKRESVEVEETSEVREENNDPDLQHQEKRYAKIQKVMKKLNQLGCTIRELEKQEVDLSDEEDSVYLKLQRFRERYWMIYKKLGEFTSGAVTNCVFDEKIHFVETKYTTINRCIEKWLNKTKSFPDFADILKILHSKSDELNLPSDKDSLRSIAIEIFQKVGEVLQRKRKYDLWNSFSDFLEDSEDPAAKHPELEKIFRQNYEIRVKKEEEIYQHYAERQEKELLQPKEISEEEASPESGNEEEEEIINIEKSLGERLLNSSAPKDRVKRVSDEGTPQSAVASVNEKETKNNFRNCKSLKWRLEKRGTSISESSDNSAAEGDVESKEKETKANRENKQSSPDLILVEPDNRAEIATPNVHQLSVPPTPILSPIKRSLPFGIENCGMKKKSLKKQDTNNVTNQKKDVENVNKNPVFDVGFCQIVTNYEYKERRKIFRDLTNLNRFMKNPGLGNKTAEFLPTLLYSRYSLKKETPWKKRFKINLRETKSKNQKCALNEEKQTGEKLSFTSNQNSEKKDSQDNADGGRQGADFTGQGNGQEEDNNDKGDENRKNGKVEDENDDCEEDDDEEKEDENAEVSEHSSNTQKTEKENEDSLEPNKEENHKLHNTENLVVENKEVYVTEGKGRKRKEKKESRQVNKSLRKKADHQFEPSNDTLNKFREAEDAEEFENLKNSLEPICVLKEGDASDEIEKMNNKSSLNVRQKSGGEKLKKGPSTRSKLRVGKDERGRSESVNQNRLPMAAEWTPPIELSQIKPRKMSTSDEERVKRFLLHSPSSISITPPKKLTLSKPPSESALQALATLRNLKGISATIVRAQPKKEDVPLIRGQTKRQSEQSSPIPAKRRRPDLPVISNVQSVNTLTPKIVTVQGNVSGFENLWPEARNNGNANSNSTSIKISKVWGSLPRTMTQASPPHYPGCSFQKSKPGTSNQMRKKNTKKQVEYVVLD